MEVVNEQAESVDDIQPQLVANRNRCCRKTVSRDDLEKNHEAHVALDEGMSSEASQYPKLNWVQRRRNEAVDVSRLTLEHPMQVLWTRILTCEMHFDQQQWT